MIVSRQQIHDELASAFHRSEEIGAAILIGSTASGSGDQYSDLDYFLYADEPNWPREKTLTWLSEAGLIPSLCYWSGVEKYHMVIDGVGVDFSIRALSQAIEVATWPTIHFPESAIVKDRDGLIAHQLTLRDSGRLRAGLDNTLHGFLYHALTCAIQLARGELVNARSRFSGVIESYICLIEGTTVGQIRWREPSRRLESRLSGPPLTEIYDLAYAGSPDEMRTALGAVLDDCEERETLTDSDRGTVGHIRALLEGRS